MSYGRIGAWLSGYGKSENPNAELQGQLRLQDEAASRLRAQRIRLGALQFDRLEAVPIIEDGQVQRIRHSDLMKETLAEYWQSPETRNRYNARVHNAAAVLASQQYRRAISNDEDPVRDTAVFLTGIPGAGKTTCVLQAGELPRYVRVVYEGQLANPAQALSKVAQALDARLRPQIVVVHIQPERALQNTLHRFETEGRGASIEAMASIQGFLPDSLRAIQTQFGGAVELRIADRRDTLETKTLRGWRHLPQLESEGNYERIKQHLAAIVERGYREGRIREEAYNQAIGRAPGEVLGRLAQQSHSGIEHQTKPFPRVW